MLRPPEAVNCVFSGSARQSLDNVSGARGEKVSICDALCPATSRQGACPSKHNVSPGFALAFRE
jgi:hypothetical protein